MSFPSLQTLQCLEVFSILFFGRPGFNGHENVTCKKFGAQTAKRYIVRHKKRCSFGTFYCAKCHKFSARSQADLNCIIAEKHSLSQPKK